MGEDGGTLSRPDWLGAGETPGSEFMICVHRERCGLEPLGSHLCHQGVLGAHQGLEPGSPPPGTHRTQALAPSRCAEWPSSSVC